MSFQQRMSRDQEAWLSMSRYFKEAAVMDWIMSNPKRFCEMVAAQQDFPFVLTPKTSKTGERASAVKKCSHEQATVLDKVSWLEAIIKSVSVTCDQSYCAYAITGGIM